MGFGVFTGAAWISAASVLCVLMMRRYGGRQPKDNDSLTDRCKITEFYWRRTNNNSNSKRYKKSIIQDEETETAAEINEQGSLVHAETIS